MAEAITNPQDLTDKIKDKIKATFIDLIPESQWESLIQSAVDNYTKPTSEHNFTGNDKVTPSCLETDVHKLLNEELKLRVNERIRVVSNNWMDGEGGIKLNTELEAILVKAAPQMLVNIMSNVAGQVMNNMNNGVSIY